MIQVWEQRRENDYFKIFLSWIIFTTSQKTQNSTSVRWVSVIARRNISSETPLIFSRKNVIEESEWVVRMTFFARGKRSVRCKPWPKILAFSPFLCTFSCYCQVFSLSADRVLSLLAKVCTFAHLKSGVIACFSAVEGRGGQSLQLGLVMTVTYFIITEAPWEHPRPNRVWNGTTSSLSRGANGIARRCGRHAWKRNFITPRKIGVKFDEPPTLLIFRVALLSGSVVWVWVRLCECWTRSACHFCWSWASLLREGFGRA